MIFKKDSLNKSARRAVKLQQQSQTQKIQKNRKIKKLRRATQNNKKKRHKVYKSWKQREILLEKNRLRKNEKI